MKFTASRLSEGNKIFPAEIHCDKDGLTVKIPGFFSGKSRHLTYSQIGEISVDTPMVGYSTITFYTAGTRVSAHGFTKSEVKQVKAAIEKGQSGTSSNDYKADYDIEDDEKNTEVEILETQLYHERRVLEEKQEHEMRLESMKAISDTVEKINSFDFGAENSTIDTIAKQVEYCITLSNSSLGETFDDIGDEKEREKYNQSEKIVNAAIKKAEIGLNKFRLCEPQDKGLNYYTIYKEQVRELKIKQIQRKYEIKIQHAKPASWLWAACIVFIPAYIYPIAKTINATVILPKKKKAEIAQLN